jgi:hypothetical protein
MGRIHIGRNVCPECRGNAVRRSHKRSATERIVYALFQIGPYRCEECGHRYFRFRSASSSPPHPRSTA